MVKQPKHIWNLFKYSVSEIPKALTESIKLRLLKETIQKNMLRGKDNEKLLKKIKLNEE